jgi:SAM-dependent methyltransferase
MKTQSGRGFFGKRREWKETMSNSWNAGYVTDITYTYGFYRELTPAMQLFAALGAGRQTPAWGERMAFCELGCGQGVSTNLLAAANPHIDFHATDFNPSQTVGARRLARQAGTPNVAFYDDSFAEFIDRPDLPLFDFISLHGIYSWISAENRQHIVRFIRRRLKPGGIVYISYNAQPGWAAAMPMRRLMIDKAANVGGGITGRVEEALGLLGRLADVESRYFKANPQLKDRLEKMKGQSRAYLAHEFFNRDWVPFYFADVVDELFEAKLSWVCSANPLDSIDAINVTADQQKLLAEAGDPVMRETLRDFIANTQFRRDLFMKGHVGLSGTEASSRWMAMRLTLSTPRADIPDTVDGLLGKAKLQEDVYAPMLDALNGKTASIRDLLAQTKLKSIGVARMQQAAMVMVGSGHVQPCLPEEGLAARKTACDRFNRAVMEIAKGGAEISYLASPVTGGGLALDRLSQLFLLGHKEKHQDGSAFVWSILSGQGQRLVHEGKALQTVEENMAELKRRHDLFAQKQLPLLQCMGIA